VYDYKHGAGTYVEVVENFQLMLYAIGAMDKYGWVNDMAEIVIAQPRFFGDDVAPVRRWEVSKAALLFFKGMAATAIGNCKKKGAPCLPSTWCAKSFCPAFGLCPAVRGEVVAVVDPECTALTFPEPAKLTPEQIVKVLEASNLISGWAKAVRDYAERQAIELGLQIPGYKLVRKFGRHAWTDEMLTENEFEPEYGDAIYDKKLKSPAQLEKVVGKERVKELVSIPDKGLELVPETAKGDAVLSAPGQVFEVIEEAG